MANKNQRVNRKLLSREKKINNGKNRNSLASPITGRTQTTTCGKQGEKSK